MCPALIHIKIIWLEVMVTNLYVLMRNLINQCNNIIMKMQLLSLLKTCFKKLNIVRTL